MINKELLRSALTDIKQRQNKIISPTSKISNDILFMTAIRHYLQNSLMIIIVFNALYFILNNYTISYNSLLYTSVIVLINLSFYVYVMYSFRLNSYRKAGYDLLADIKFNLTEINLNHIQQLIVSINEYTTYLVDNNIEFDSYDTKLLVKIQKNVKTSRNTVIRLDSIIGKKNAFNILLIIDISFVLINQFINIIELILEINDTKYIDLEAQD